MTAGEVERLPVQQGAGQSRRPAGEDLQRALPFFAAVFAHEIKVAPIGGDFGEELRRASEHFTIQELVFDESVSVGQLYVSMLNALQVTSNSFGDASATLPGLTG